MKTKENKKKLNIDNLKEFPKIKIRKLFFDIAIPTENYGGEMFYIGSLKIAIDFILALMGKYIEFGDYRFNTQQSSKSEYWVGGQFEIGLSVFKILFYLLFNLRKRSEYERV